MVLVQQQLHFVGVGLALRPPQLHQVRVEGPLHFRLREGVDEDADGRVLLLEEVDVADLEGLRPVAHAEVKPCTLERVGVVRLLRPVV